MTEPEVKFEVDEHGRIGYRVTNEGVLLSRDEKEFIIDSFTQLKAENAELRELLRAAWKCIHSGLSCSDCRLVAGGCTLQSAMRELGVEVEG